MIRVTVRQNLAKPLPGKRVEVDPEKETFTIFKEKCTEVLGFKAETVYNLYGQKINMLADIQNNEVYYISSVSVSISKFQGEPFAQTILSSLANKQKENLIIRES